MAKPMITFTQTGNFKRTEKFLRKASDLQIQNVLSKYARMGCDALLEATPMDTGETALAWDYQIELYDDGYKIIWTNSHIEDGWANIALLLQYGHATRNGGWVQGTDYINPALQPIFEKLANDAWKEVRKL